MSKQEIFLNDDNVNATVKMIYRRHVDDGGMLSPTAVAEQVRGLMTDWIGKQQVDTYESLVYDPVSEIEALTNEFVRVHLPTFTAGDDYKQVRRQHRLQTPWDYHNFDTAPRADAVSVDSSVYRYGNAVPYYQRQPSRPYDTDDDGSGLMGESMMQDVRGTGGDMNAVMERMDQPYRTSDTQDVQYYGQQWGDSNTELMNTMWKSS